MNSKLLKLDAPYNVIYAGGRVGRHIATLMVWDDDEEMGIMDAVSYPVIDEGREFPAGTLCDDAELHDCRVLCPAEGNVTLSWVAKVIEHDFRQIEPAGAEYILERMNLLKCEIKMPVVKNEAGEEVLETDFELSMNIWKVSGPIGNDDEGVFRVNTLAIQGFYFEAMGTPEEIYSELEYQKSVYHGAFYDRGIFIKIRFYSDDGYINDVIKRLNESRY